jgi:excinuclease ABC subunit A
MTKDLIRIRGARTHNLKNIDLDLPRNQLILITGLSGSGKSSLAFDTLYAEGQRRYVASLSAYARQFLSVMEKPDVDSIDGLSPAIAIEQKSSQHNPRSTIGTVTEIYDYLRVLFARVGEARCPTHGLSLTAQSITQMLEHILSLPEGTRIMLLAPVLKQRKGQHVDLLTRLVRCGYLRVRIDQKIIELDPLPQLSANQKHSIDVVVDRLTVHASSRTRLADSLETSLGLSQGLVILAILNDNQITQELIFSTRFACSQCDYSMDELEPRLFSFNNPIGACPHCNGLGVEELFDPDKILRPQLSLRQGAIANWDPHYTYYFALLQSLAAHYSFSLDQPFQTLAPEIQQIILYGSRREKIKLCYQNAQKQSLKRFNYFPGVIPTLQKRYQDTELPHVKEELARYLSNKPCVVCHGKRLCLEARHVFIAQHTLPDLVNLSLDQLYDFLRHIQLQGHHAQIIADLKKEIMSRLHFLLEVGLDYLTLDRRADSLSGGEAQRIRLASQIGSGLVGVLYILDEPSIGLHPRDHERLLNTLVTLRDLGNTVIVVEHDEATMRRADYIVDIGPGAGVHGGRVIAQGSPEYLMKQIGCLTADYLSGRRSIPIPSKRISPNPERILRLEGASAHNLRTITVEFPLGLIICITGVSGSGKSTLIYDTLEPIVRAHLQHQPTHQIHYQSALGLEHLDKIIAIDQSPIGRTPRSNPSTYIGLFSLIRELFAATQEARARGYPIGRFSFNVKGGRCETCEGGGLIKIEMHFLADVYVTCSACKGQRYNFETLEIQYKDKNIYQILEMTVEEALTFFQSIPKIVQKLKYLVEVGLGYIKVGQSATTLSGGEAQRVKLAKELSKRATGKTLYLLDEPTTGLHIHDVAQLLILLQRLRDKGNTIILIEHHLEVIKTADWIIDLGPEGGHRGGEIIGVGTPETLAQNERSYTGAHLKHALK